MTRCPLCQGHNLTPIGRNGLRICLNCGRRRIGPNSLPVNTKNLTVEQRLRILKPGTTMEITPDDLKTANIYAAYLAPNGYYGPGTWMKMSPPKGTENHWDFGLRMTTQTAMMYFTVIKWAEPTPGTTRIHGLPQPRQAPLSQRKGYQLTRRLAFLARGARRTYGTRNATNTDTSMPKPNTQR